METQKGNRTAWIRVQIMEQLPGGEIYMYFEKPHGEQAPIYFSAKTGSSGPEAHKKLKAILDKEAKVAQPAWEVKIPRRFERTGEAES